MELGCASPSFFFFATCWQIARNTTHFTASSVEYQCVPFPWEFFPRELGYIVKIYPISVSHWESYGNFFFHPTLLFPSTLFYRSNHQSHFLCQMALSTSTTSSIFRHQWIFNNTYPFDFPLRIIPTLWPNFCKTFYIQFPTWCSNKREKANQLLLLLTLLRQSCLSQLWNKFSEIAIIEQKLYKLLILISSTLI